ncbi:helix-turn-helix domain-containing protein [Paenibacillus sp. FSL H7-0357]|uniref:helix-turn-helix domain-containing protein n=1 Tax=Paenibacillus sp. FSL H7-0357 TaxID=1536774 RepID=UPI00068C5DC3|nr:helix-turn-helix domain-containing protein [Paenibacillus sp. FSL H7-0357]
MKYSELLSKYIEESGLSLGEIAIRLSNKNIKIDRSYISKLKNGNKPPASEDVTRALAEVTGGDTDALLLAGHIEKAPEEIKEGLIEYNASHRMLKNESLQFHCLSALDAIRDFKNRFLTTEVIEEDLLNNMLSTLSYFTDIEIDEDLIRSNPFGASEFLSNRITKRLEEFYAANTNYSARVDLNAYNNISDIKEKKQQYEDDETSKNRKDLIEMIKQASEEDLPDLKILVKRFIK